MTTERQSFEALEPTYYVEVLWINNPATKHTFTMMLAERSASS